MQVQEQAESVRSGEEDVTEGNYSTPSGLLPAVSEPAESEPVVSEPAVSGPAVSKSVPATTTPRPTRSRTPGGRKKVEDYRLYWLERKYAGLDAGANTATGSFRSARTLLADLNAAATSTQAIASQAEAVITKANETHAAVTSLHEMTRRQNADAALLNDESRRLHTTIGERCDEESALIRQVRDGLVDVKNSRNVADSVLEAIAEAARIAEGLRESATESATEARKVIADTGLLAARNSSLQAELAAALAETLDTNRTSTGLQSAVQNHLSAVTRLQSEWQQSRVSLDQVQIEATAALARVQALCDSQASAQADHLALRDHTSALRQDAQVLLDQVRDTETRTTALREAGTSTLALADTQLARIEQALSELGALRDEGRHAIADSKTALATGESATRAGELALQQSTRAFESAIVALEQRAAVIAADQQAHLEAALRQHHDGLVLSESTLHAQLDVLANRLEQADADREQRVGNCLEQQEVWVGETTRQLEEAISNQQASVAGSEQKIAFALMRQASALREGEQALESAIAAFGERNERNAAARDLSAATTLDNLLIRHDEALQEGRTAINAATDAAARALESRFAGQAQKLGATERALVKQVEDSLETHLQQILQIAGAQVEALQTASDDRSREAICALDAWIRQQSEFLIEATDLRTAALQNSCDETRAALMQAMQDAVENTRAHSAETEQALHHRTDAALMSLDEELSVLRRERAAFAESTAQSTALQQKIDHDLNALSITSAAAVAGVEATLAELEEQDRSARAFHEVLIQDAALLRDEGISLRDQLGDLQLEMQLTQQDAVRSQELSQEINAHSLALNERNTAVLSRFDQLNERNSIMMTELTRLKTVLSANEHEIEAQLQAVNLATSSADSVCTRFEQLEAENAAIHLKMANTLEDANAHIEATTTLNQNAGRLLAEMTGERDLVQQSLTQLAAALEASTAATQNTVSAGDIGRVLNEALAGAIDTVRQLETRNAAVIDAVEARAERLDATLDTVEGANLRVNEAIDRSEQITDDLFRGLQAAMNSQRTMEENITGCVAETARLHEQICDTLSLEQGVEGFRSALDDNDAKVEACMVQARELAATVAGQARVLETLEQQNSRLAEEREGYDATIERLASRLERCEARIMDQESRTETMVASAQSDLKIEADRLNEQLTRELSRLLRRSEEGFARQQEQNDLSLDKRLATFERQLQEAKSDTELADLSARLLVTDENVTRVSDQVALVRSSESSELHRMAEATDHQFDELFERLSTIETDSSDARRTLSQLEASQSLAAEHLLDLRAAQKQAAAAPDASHLADLISRFNAAMDEAIHTNRELRADQHEPAAPARVPVADVPQQVEPAAPAPVATSTDDARQPPVARTYPTRDPLVDRQSRSPHVAPAPGLPAHNRRPGTLVRTSVADALSPAAPGIADQPARRPVRAPAQPLQATGRAKQAVLTSIIGALLLFGGLFAGREIDARPAFTSLAPLELETEMAGLAGEFGWPVSQAQTETSGPSFQHVRNGINIPAELGDPVVAVQPGKVVHSGQSVRGYGNLIVIEHDKGLHSVYANNQYNYVQTGDVVKRGQLIADVGRLADTRQPGLYFELRDSGQARDPLDYLSTDLPTKSAATVANNLTSSLTNYLGSWN